MKKLILVCILIFVIVFGNSFASYFVSNLSYYVSKSNVRLEWYQPVDYTNTYLYYNIYYSSNLPIFDKGNIVNFLDLELIGVVKYSTNTPLSFTTSNYNQGYYIVIPVTNGFFIFEDPYSLVVPKITNLISNTNLTNVSLLYTSTNEKTNSLPSVSTQLQSSKPVVGITNFIDELSVEYSNNELRYILKNLFFKGKYETSLKKLFELRNEVVDEKERDLIDIYISRCYYALGNKRKAIKILLKISEPKIKDLAEFWLDRFSKYF